MKTEVALAALKRFKEQHGKEFDIVALGVFGSVARDTAGESSDVDIVFKTDTPNLFRASRMRQELIKLLGCDVDVIRVRDRMNPNLKARIEREAKYV